MNNNLEFYNQLIEKFSTQIKNTISLNDQVQITCNVLSSEEAIGTPKRKDYPLLQGKEVLVEANYKNSKGQAFTDTPVDYQGSIIEILNLDFSDNGSRTILIAAINAVIHYLDRQLKTRHCVNEEPEQCAFNISQYLSLKNYKKILLIGLQPAILDTLSSKFSLTVLDRDKKNIGRVKRGILIRDGYKNNEHYFSNADVVLATGSSVVNGSIVEILKNVQKYNVDLYFYGITIAASAHLLGFNRLCFNGH